MEMLNEKNEERKAEKYNKKNCMQHTTVEEIKQER